MKFQKAQLLSLLNCQDNRIVSQDKKVKEMDTFLGKLEQQHITLSEQKENDKQKLAVALFLLSSILYFTWELDQDRVFHPRRKMQ